MFAGIEGTTFDRRAECEVPALLTRIGETGAPFGGRAPRSPPLGAFNGSGPSRPDGSAQPGTARIRRFESAADATLGGHGQDAFWAWRLVMAPLYDIAVPSTAALADFTVAASWCHLGRMLLAKVDAAPYRLRRSPMTIACTATDHYLVQHHVGGRWYGMAGKRAWTAGDGDISVLDLAQPVDAEAEGGTVAIVVPRPLLAPLLRKADALHGLTVPQTSPLARLLGDYLRSLVARAPELSPGEASVVTSASVALIAECLHPALDQAGPVSSDMAPAIIAAKRYIEDRLTGPDLTPESIARDCGLSRANLYRLFEPAGGVAQYIRERRLFHCYAEIVSPTHGHRRIGDIAYDWGFPDETVFSRAFRRSFGLSPREARAARRPGGNGAGGGVQSDTRSHYNTLELWLRELGNH